MALVKCNHCGKKTRDNHPLFLARCIWCNKELEKDIENIEDVQFVKEFLKQKDIDQSNNDKYYDIKPLRMKKFFALLFTLLGSIGVIGLVIGSIIAIVEGFEFYNFINSEGFTVCSFLSIFFIIRGFMINREMINDINKWVKKKVYRFLCEVNGDHSSLEIKHQVEILRNYMYTGNITYDDSAILRKFISASSIANSFIPALLVSLFLGIIVGGIIGVFIFIWWKRHGVEWLTPNPDSNDFINKAAAKKYRDYDD